MVENARKPTETEIEPLREWGFSELQQRVRNIYELHDIKCEYGPDTMLAKISGSALALQKLLRKNPGDFESIDRNLTNVFIWTATFANRANFNLQEIMEEKFGQGCPHCKQMPCLLTKGEKCSPPQFESQEKPKLTPPSNMQEWQEHLKRMYSNNFEGDITKDTQFASSKLYEEAGELSGSSYLDILRELSEASFENIGMSPQESEIADVLAWAFAVSNCLDIQNGSYSAEKSLKEKYKNGCPYCTLPQCDCPKAKTFIEELKLNPKI